MLSAEAVRLVAFEMLLPTAAQSTAGPYPTLAGARVYDSCAVSISNIDSDAPYTPALSLYTPESGAALRGPLTDATDTAADCVLDVVAELCIVTRDAETGQTYVDAMADGDANARLVLAALAAQVRHILERSETGFAWRRLVRQVERVEAKTFGVPEYGLRWQRLTIRFHLSIRDDDFQAGGGLPEPIRSVHAALPDGSYAKAKLTELAGHFLAQTPTALQRFDGVAKAGDEVEISFGPDFSAP